jgi:hypothetical protein
MRENLIKKLMTASKCTVCGQHYRVNDVSVIGHEDNLWFLTVSCSVCQAQYLVAAIIQEESTPEAVTDLIEAEQDRFERVEAVSADDVLNMHGFLSDFDGDFRRLFSHGGLE